MKEITNEEIKRLEKERDKYYKKTREISDKIIYLKLKEMNLSQFENKYIKYEEEEGFPVYMKVDWVTLDSGYFSNMDYCYLFRGLGFYSEFTGYGDMTLSEWSYWYEFRIYGNEDEFMEKIGKIKIIDKEEFDSAFEEMINQMKEFHYKNIDD